MKFEELSEMWSIDCKIDKTDITGESIRTPMLHAKYLKFYGEQSLKLKSLIIKRKKLQATLKEYYQGDLNNPHDLEEIGREPWPKKVLKNEVQYYIDNDRDMDTLNVKIAYKEEIVNMLKEIVDSINRRGFVIKNIIDFERFMGGM